MIGGNIDAIVQIKKLSGKNDIGEREESWLNVLKIKGWLDFASGEAKYSTYNAKIQESSHLFLCDYQEDIRKLCYLLDDNSDYIFDEDNVTIRTRTSADNEITDKVTSENARMIVDGQMYDILLIDDPMNLHQHYEFYLKLVGLDG